MNSRRFYHIWICLLCLLPALVTAQTLTQYEYWFDDGFDNRITMGLSGTEKDVTAGLDTRSLGNGLHQFFLRLKQSDGMYSPITSQYFFKAQVEDSGALEYWFDDNRSGCKRIASHLASDGKAYVVNTAIDVTNISAGYHRFYYRFVNEDGSVCSATSMTPVVLHSKYNVEAADLKVTRYSVAVDDEAPLELEVPSPRNEIALPYTLDARRFSAGNHTLKTKFWNSVGVNVTDQSTFKVVAQETPSITLSATEKDGYVTLTFNSIPNDIHYVVGRRDASGKARKVYETYNSNYPNSFSVIDHPDEGSYTYHVKAVYTDSEGNKHGISTDDQPITIAAGIPTTEMGRIVGRVVFGTEEIDLISAIRKIYVEFSDGGEKVRVEPNGTFYREGVPLGSKLTLSIPDDDYYTYEKVDLEVTKDTQNEVQIIKATRRNDSNVQISNEDYDLMITNFVNQAPVSFEFDIKNTTSRAWSGDIALIALKPKDASKITSVTDGKVTFASKKPYYKVGRTTIKNLGGYGKTQHVEIKITDFPELKDDEAFAFYFVSEKDEQYKNIEFESDKLKNPVSVVMPSSSPAGHDYWDFAGDEIDAYLVDVFKTMKELDKWDGPIAGCMTQLSKALSQYERDNNLDGFYGNLPDMLSAFAYDLKNAVKDVKEITTPAKKLYDVINDIQTFQGDDSFSKFITICKRLWGLTGDPFSKVYLQYLEVAEKAVERIYKLQEKLIDYQLDDIFSQNEIIFKLKVEVTHGNWKDYLPTGTFYLSADFVADQIENVEITLISEDAWGGQHVNTGYYHAVGSAESEEVVFHRDNFKGMSNLGYKVKRFWMKINWQHF